MFCYVVFVVQVVALVQVMMDEHYRTVAGFQQLVQKEWCAFGHRFKSRCGYWPDNQPLGVFAGKIAPVFLQFLARVSPLCAACGLSTACPPRCQRPFNGTSATLLLWTQDCVWQLMQQHPAAFEFNERFLLTIQRHTSVPFHS